jgi:hypothetical protein
MPLGRPADPPVGSLGDAMRQRKGPQPAKGPLRPEGVARLHVPLCRCVSRVSARTLEVAARSMSAASPVGELSPSRASGCPSIIHSASRPRATRTPASAPGRRLQSPPSTKGRSPRRSVVATVSRSAAEAAATSSAAMTPVAPSRSRSRSGGTTSPASRRPRRSRRPAERSSCGACSSPSPSPDESSGAPSNVHCAFIGQRTHRPISAAS